MAFNTAAGSTLAISTTTTTADDTTSQANFEALAYTPVGEVEEIPQFGDETQIVEFIALANSRVRKRKGSKNAGNLTIPVAFDSADTGQDAMRTAAAANSAYAFRIQLNDGSDGSPSAPTTLFFVAYVTSDPINPGNVDNVVRQSFTLAIDSAIILVDAV